MTGPVPEPGRDDPEEVRDPTRAEQEHKRARRRTRVFGEVLPEGTSDESVDWGERDRGGGSEEWLRGQVPPHHG